jgi:hypothetical protein
MSNLVVMAWLLSLGFTPHSSLETSGGSINASGCLVQTLGVGFYLADFVHIYSTVEIQETKSQGVYFDPFRCDFLIGGSFHFKNFSIGLSHECNHDIVTNMDFHIYNGWEAGFDKAYINYTIPINITSKFILTPSITLGDQFTEKLRIKSNDTIDYFRYGGLDVSPTVLFAEFQLTLELSPLRSRAAFQAGYAARAKQWAYTQFNLEVELFYKNISLGLEYINRKKKQKDSGYSLEGLTLFVRFSGKSSLL